MFVTVADGTEGVANGRVGDPTPMRPYAGAVAARRRMTLVALGLAGVVGLGACAQGGADPAALRTGLQRAGLTAEQADCVVDRMRADLDPGVLDSRSEPTGAERTAVERVLRACGVTPRRR